MRSRRRRASRRPSPSTPVLVPTVAALLVPVLVLSPTPASSAFVGRIVPRAMAKTKMSPMPMPGRGRRGHHPRPHVDLSPRGASSAAGAADDDDGGDRRRPNGGHVSAAAGERREEERRRRERKNDVVVGQTSAMPDAKDYTIDPRRTEAEFLRSAGDVDREVHVQTDRGMECLRMLRLEEAREAFDRVHALKPDAYVSQSGVVLYYLDDVHAASVRFARDARLYENRFGGVASEERIWRDACYLRLLSGLPRKDRRRAAEEAAAAHREEGGEWEWSQGEDEDDEEEDDGMRRRRNSLMPIVPSIPPPDVRETRKVLRIAMDLFDASVSGDPARVVLSRARLRAIAEAADDPRGDSGDAEAAARRRRMRVRRRDPMGWRLSSWYYLGLHHDAMGESDESRRCMKEAIGLSRGGNHGDILHCLPIIHMARRDWFDDDVMSPAVGAEGDGNNDLDDPMGVEGDGGPPGSGVFDLADFVRDGIQNMTAADITDALKQKGLKSSGSKVVLQERLFGVLWKEVKEGEGK